ncbi:MAG: competence protein ComEC [Pirellulaceae bacterium]|nr:MAG: competence protein ComEC [Pirellulaceae bacterium]
MLQGWQSTCSATVRRYPMLWAAALVILGGQIPWYQNWDSSLFQATAFTAAVVLVLLTVMGTRRYQPWCLLSAGAALFLFGAWYASITLPPDSDDLMGWANREPTPVLIKGVIASAGSWRPTATYRADEPHDHRWRTEWKLRCTAMQDQGRWVPISAQVLLNARGRITDILPGDQVEVRGDLSRILPPTNPGGFDYATYLRGQGIFTTLRAESRDQVHPCGRDAGWWYARVRAQIVRAVDRTLWDHVGPTHGALATALVIGQRQQVDWESQQALMATGTLHLLAISGLHVEIVAWSLLLLCALFHVDGSARLMGIAALCIFYALLADAKPPVVRAVVLVLAFEYSRWWGRPTRLTNLLALAALILFLIRVNHFEDAGVQLSFLAVAAIGALVTTRADAPAWLWRLPVPSEPTPDRSLRRSLWRGARRWMTSMLRLSFWVWLATCPLVWTHFHVIAPVGVLLNILLAIPLALALLSGLLTAAVGWIGPLAAATGICCHFALEAITYLVAWGSSLPGGHFWLPSPPVGWTVAFYGYLVLHLLWLRNRYRMLLSTLLLSWIAIGMGWTLWKPHRVAPALDTWGDAEQPRLAATFLDVGHGLSVIIEHPHGEVWLYDAGRLGPSQQHFRTIADALWALGITRIDRLILSHADSDHYNAVPGLIPRFRIGEAVSTPQFWNSNEGEAQKLKQLLRQSTIPVVSWSTDTTASLSSGATQWAVLHPPAEWQGESDNAASLTLLIEHADRRLLLPGDLEGRGLLDLAQLPPRPCDILLVPHHGSLNTDPRPLIQWCRPEWMIISGGIRAGRPEVIEHYHGARSGLAITFLHGAVRCEIDHVGNLYVAHWVDDGWIDLSPPTP